MNYVIQMGRTVTNGNSFPFTFTPGVIQLGLLR
jgi:hypothetical protein